MPRPAHIAALCLAVAACLESGCSGGATGGDPAQARAKMRAVGVEYGRYLGQHGGKPPADEAAFKEFLGQRIAQTPDYGVASADELLAAGRDGQPIKVVTGSILAPPDQPDLAWAAYEQTGADGTRLAVNVRGTVLELGPEEFAQSVPVK